jgi:hypothetical protein
VSRRSKNVGNREGAGRRKCTISVRCHVSSLLIILSSVGWSTVAVASLGNKLPTIEADRAHLSASANSEILGAATVHTLTSPNGGIVKEYSATDGTIFAVSWKGPARPDLRQLLGDRFSAMSSMNHPGRRYIRRIVAVQRPSLVILSQGHPGAFFGFAYDPSLVPSGFSLDALR